ncbi:MAG: carbohydrate ABC transporter permease [Micromonosporaceae bacterium]
MTFRQDASDRRSRQGRLRRSAAGWGFALPFVAMFTVFMVGPVVASLLMSVTDIRSADLRDPFAVNLTGAENYLRLLQDELFLKAARNTALVVFTGLPLTVAFGLAVALGVNSGLTRFKAVFRVGYYLPVVTSIVAIAVVWRFVYQRDYGLVNGALGLIGVDGPNWLGDTSLALPALIVMIAWRGLGFQMVIFLAGLQAIPQHLYEAASIDGASRWQQFWHVTLPSLKPTLLLGSVIGTVGLVLVFEEPFVMTRGGPLDSTVSVSQYVYSQFGFGNYGYASAMSYVLFAAIAALSLAWFRLMRTET